MKDLNSEDMFDAISHPIRMKILQKLSKKSMGFSELKRELGIKSSGKLDFHLKKLGKLIELDREGKYALTREGCVALQAIEVIKRYEWQKRAYYLNLGAYFLINLYFALVNFSLWFQIVFPLSTAWIAFYTYWTLRKRRALISSKFL